MTGAERRVVGMSAGLREEPVLADNNSATLTTRSRQARANGQGSPAARLRGSCRMPQMPVRPWRNASHGSLLRVKICTSGVTAAGSNLIAPLPRPCGVGVNHARRKLSAYLRDIRVS